MVDNPPAHTLDKLIFCVDCGRRTFVGHQAVHREPEEYLKEGETVEYSYKFRLYPTAEQQEQMSRNFGCCRYVFNHFLTQRQEQYKKTGKAPTRFQQDKSLTMLKQELPWLKEVDSTSLQATLQDLDAAFQNFFRRVKQGEKPGYPRFKSKHDHRQSYKSKCVGTNIKVLDKAVQLPKLGRVKCRISKEVKGRVLSATVSRNPSQVFRCAMLYGGGNRTSALHRGRRWPRHGRQVLRCHLKRYGIPQPQISVEV